MAPDGNCLVDVIPNFFPKCKVNIEQLKFVCRLCHVLILSTAQTLQNKFTGINSNVNDEHFPDIQIILESGIV